MKCACNYAATGCSIFCKNYFRLSDARIFSSRPHFSRLISAEAFEKFHDRCVHVIKKVSEPDLGKRRNRGNYNVGNINFFCNIILNSALRNIICRNYCMDVDERKFNHNFMQQQDRTEN